MKKLLYTLSLLLGLATLTPALAIAQTGAAANVGATVNATVTTPAANVNANANVKAETAVMTKAKTRAAQELKRRVDSLTAINARVQAMQSVTPNFKQARANAIQTQISAFQGLDEKIKADTDDATLKADVQSITQSYRVYALVLPQVRISAAADRAVTISTMMQTLANKLGARVQAAADAGADVTAMQKTFTDFGAKISDASTQAQASVSAAAALTSDNGDSTKMAANTATLKEARANLKTVEADLKAARADITTIVKGLSVLEAKVKANANASSTTSVQ